LKVGEIEVGIRALEYDDTKARTGVHSREHVLQALEHVGVHDVERRIIKHHSPVRRRFLDDAQVRRWFSHDLYSWLHLLPGKPVTGDSDLLARMPDESAPPQS